MTTLNILSAGAIESGVRSAAAMFSSETGIACALTRGTAPMLRQKVDENVDFDLICAPSSLIAELTGQTRLRRSPNLVLGRVGVGIIAHPACAMDMPQSVEDMKHSLRAARRIVINRASTGQFVERMLAGFLTAEDLSARLVRHDTGDAVLADVAGQEGSIGFAAIPEIRRSAHPVSYLGSLPPTLQNYTVYEAALSANAAHPQEAERLLAFLGTPASRDIVNTNGIEPPADLTNGPDANAAGHGVAGSPLQTSKET